MAGLSTRLRLRLVMLGLIIVIPALAFIVYDQTVERTRARARAVENTLRLARLTATQEAGVFEGVQRLLLTLS